MEGNVLLTSPCISSLTEVEDEGTTERMYPSGKNCTDSISLLIYFGPQNSLYNITKIYIIRNLHR